MSSLLVGFSVFAISLAIMVYLGEIVENLRVLANHIRPFESLISIAVIPLFLMTIYYGYYSNFMDRFRPRVFNPYYKSSEDFEKEKKMETKDALRKLINSPEYRAYE
jgi:hypothetical protein